MSHSKYSRGDWLMVRGQLSTPEGRDGSMSCSFTWKWTCLNLEIK